MPPPVDDYDSPEEAELQIDYCFDRIIVVDNIPVIDSSKLEKLNNVLLKLYSQVCPTLTAKDITMPFDEKNTSKGVVFIEFPDKATAERAVASTNGHPLDKSHIFRVNLLQDTERIMGVQEHFVEPKFPPYNEMQDLGFWLHDDRAREMFLIKFGEESEVYWHETAQAPKRLYRRDKWTEFRHDFSPKGSYLITFHKPGIGLWGGSQWERLNRFPHALVKYADFSPCEKYLVTMSESVETGPGGRPITSETQQTVIFWEIATGRNAREFKIEAKSSTWPVFKWSHDDKFFARLADGAISVYATPEMTLLDKKSLKFPGVKDFSWSPTQNIISTFLPEQGDAPAKIVLVELPSRKELRQKNLFSVSDIKMEWQSNGDYLAVRVDRHSKSKKTTLTNFEIFRVRERDVPIEVFEVNGGKDQIVAFAWEPKGHRFCLAHGEPPRVDVSFYSMKAVVQAAPVGKGKGKKGAAAAPVTEIDKITHLRTLEKKPVNQIFWAPAGGFVVLAGLAGLNGKLHFYNLNSFEMMAEEEHFMCTNVEWDPSGRFVATYVCGWRQQMENGYSIWSFCGKILARTMVEKFFQFMWRPRPPSLLTSTKQKDIAKNLDTYAKKYLEEDEKLKHAADYEAQAGKRKIREQFLEGERRRQQLYKERAAQRAALRGGAKDEPDESDYIVEEKLFEEVLDVKEEVVRD